MIPLNLLILVEPYTLLMHLKSLVVMLNIGTATILIWEVYIIYLLTNQSLLKLSILNSMSLVPQSTSGIKQSKVVYFTVISVSSI